MTEMNKMILATKNAGKLKEFQAFLAPHNIEVVSLADFENVPEIIEDGTTFEENAAIKAKVISEHFQLPVVAEDSGLMIDALNGEPGVYSARYAGDHDDAANIVKVLAKLNGVAEAERTAAFHTAIVAMKPNGERLVANGQVDGLILEEERGEDGFGYDPIFFYPPFEKSFAELTMTEKNQISHRGRALQNFITELPTWWEV